MGSSRVGAPSAVQEADRFHLVANVSAELDDLLRSRHRHIDVQRLQEVVETDGPVPPPETLRPLTRAKLRELAVRAQRVARWEEVRRRRTAGEGIRQITRGLGINRRTVRRLVRAPTPPDRQPRAPRELTGLRSPSLAPYVPYLAGRWRAGCTNSSQLCREIVAQGYTASSALLHQALLPWREPRPPRAERQRQRQARRRCSVRWLCLRPPEQLDAEEQIALQKILAEAPDLAAGHALVQAFRRLVRERDLTGLDAWLARAQDRGLPPFVSFVRGVTNDREAVEQAFIQRWSNGQLEGHVHRVKLLKRQGYGRASLPTLRARILAA